MALDLTKPLEDAKLEDLQSASLDISKELEDRRAVLRAINDEMAIRENHEPRLKHLENLTDVEINRLLAERAARQAKAQTISSAGDVATAEGVVGLASIQKIG